MTPARIGDTVKVHYTGTLDDGTPFDSSVDGEPFEVALGSKDVVSSFEQGIEGMKVGEKKTIRIPAEDAYGEHHEELLQQIPISEINVDYELKPGMEIQAETHDGNSFVLIVRELNGDKVTLDGNHPLAGEALNFELELVEITPQ